MWPWVATARVYVAATITPQRVPPKPRDAVSQSSARPPRSVGRSAAGAGAARLHQHARDLAARRRDHALGAEQAAGDEVAATKCLLSRHRGYREGGPGGPAII